jgi:hypothetical protein
MNEETLDANDETVYTPQLGGKVNPEPELEEVGEGKAEEAVETADSSPDSEDNHEKITGVQKRINELTAKRYEEQRRADALEAKLKEIEASKAQAPTAPTTIEAPVMPDDVYDTEAMAKYHKDMIAYSTQVAQQAASSTFEQQQQAQQKQAQEAAVQQAVSNYAANAVKDGVDLEKARAAENFLAQAGMKQELGNYLLNDPNGAKVVEYLGDNPSEAYELLALDPVTAGIKIATEIKPKALSTTPRVSRAPEPVPEIKGGGVSDKDDFEQMFPGTEFI